MNIVYAPQFNALGSLLTEFATGHGFYEGIAALDGNDAFAPDSGNKIYRVNATGDMTLSFDLSRLDLDGKAVTFETWITVATPSVSVTLPSVSEVDYLAPPDTGTSADNETLFLAWRVFKGADGSPVIQGSLYHKGRG